MRPVKLWLKDLSLFERADSKAGLAHLKLIENWDARQRKALYSLLWLYRFWSGVWLVSE